VSSDHWYILLGVLLAGITLTGKLIERLPMSTAMVYFAVGLLIGPHGFHIVRLDVTGDEALLEHAAEAAVLVSLFTAGLKLRAPLSDHGWKIALRLVSVSMLLTILLGAWAASLILSLPAAAALLLGAMIAPTDPVLASEVQVTSPFDRSRIRFGLTGEAGMNDGAAMPAIVLGLAAIEHGTIWNGALIARELANVIVGGAAGFGIGNLVGRLALRLRSGRQIAERYNDFLALGLMAMTYGMAQIAGVNGFVAVFAAGYALRRIEMRTVEAAGSRLEVLPLSKERREELARDPVAGPQYLAATMLVFDEHYERVAELAMVIVLGVLFPLSALSWSTVAFAAIVMVIVRPVAVFVGLVGSGCTAIDRAYLGWFGLRGLASLYYLEFAIRRDLPSPLVEPIAVAVMTVISMSIVVHGLSATPLMRTLERRHAPETAVAKS
jgi:NhaP-type Na+/H+ or K+/H+ antiporter